MPLDMDGIKQKKAQQGGGGWRPEEGPNEVRILPPTSRYFEDDISFIALEFHIHYFKQEGYDTEVSRCLRDKREYCPACVAVGKAKNSDDPALEELADDVNRARRFAFNIIDMEEPDLGVQQYLGGVTIRDSLIDYISNPKWGDFLDPKNGRNVTINLVPANKSSSGWNKYSVQPDPDTMDVTGILPDDWKQDLDNLKHALPEYMGKAAMLRILDRMGFPVESDLEEDEGDSEPTAKSKPKKKPTPEPEPEDEEEEPEEPEEPSEEPEEEEEDESPSSASPASQDPTREALERAGNPDDIIDPPASSEDQTPYCFGDYQPEDHPCESCEVKGSCQRAMLGMG